MRAQIIVIILSFTFFSNYSLPEPLNLDDLLHDESPGVEDEDVPLLEVRRGSQPSTDEEPQFRQSDLVLSPKSDPALNQLESKELRQLGLEQQARLLEKDRELAKAGQKVGRVSLPLLSNLALTDVYVAGARESTRGGAAA